MAGSFNAQYQQVQPRVKAVCETYGLPYVQDSLFRRFVRLWKILLGVESMKIGYTSESGVPDCRDGMLPHPIKPVLTAAGWRREGAGGFSGESLAGSRW